MGKNAVFVMVPAFCLSILLASPASARGLLGHRYADLQFSVTRPGDDALRDADSSVLGLGVGLNWPVSDHVDFNFAFSHQQFEARRLWGRNVDVDTSTFLGGLNFLLSPGAKTCPFLMGRFGFVHSSLIDTEPVVALGAGVQLDLTDTAALAPSLVFQHVDHVDDVTLGVDGNLWLAEDLVGIAGIGYGFDEGDLVFALGIGLGF